MIEQYQPAVVQQEIDGILYTSSKFPTMQGLKLLRRAVLLLGEAGLQAIVLSRMRRMPELAASLSRTPSPGLAKAAVSIAFGLEDTELPRDLCANLKANKLRPGDKSGKVGPAFDTHFQGELPHLVSVLWFVLTHNFAGFTLGSLSMSGSPTSDETPTDEPSSSESQSEESDPETSNA